MTKIKLNDRVRHVDGRIGTVIHDEGEGDVPLLVHWDGSAYVDWACRDVDCEIAEVIGHRYFVDTPFEIGKTYNTKSPLHKERVVAVGLVCENQYGGYTARHPCGAGFITDKYDLLLPAKPANYEGTIMEINGIKYRLTPVEDE